MNIYGAGPDVVWKSGQTLSVFIGGEAAPVALTAADMLRNDLKAVLDAPLAQASSPEAADIVVDIAEKSAIAPQGFDISINVNGQLHISASDSHGAAYGLLEISRIIGVSPWEWWADVAPLAKESVTIPGTMSLSAAPSVAYRGIFINDEDWGLMPWSCTNHDPADKGVIGPRTTRRIFELLLRLRANTYWPPMHECSVPFFLTDGNREVAQKYGIYIGGSHCEPMGCNIAGEWPRRGVGDYNYATNADFIKKFWTERVNETKNQEIIYTLGMRGVHDGAMQGADDNETRKEILQGVIADQREILANTLGRDLTRVPQVFIPYKEVLDVYNAGLDVPDDVTLIWCDDNYGYIRHFPTKEEAARPGGNGIYYHVSYWGRPHDYLWLGTFSPGLLFQQMDLAFDKGIRSLWILNVGDIKPAEYQIELFMDMAWNIDLVRRMGVENHLRSFYAREFGDGCAEAVADAMKEHFRLSFIRKPEFMANTRVEEADKQYYSTVRDLDMTEEECRERLRAYDDIAKRIDSIGTHISEPRLDAFFQLVKYPVLAASQMNRKFLYAQLARHGKADWAPSHQAFDSIAALTRTYNMANRGKWNGIMDCRPRKLPVFDKVEERADTLAMPLRPQPLHVCHGDGLSGQVRPLAMLGHHNRAAALDGHASFVFNSADALEIAIEFGMLPTHPVDGDILAFDVELDGEHIGRIEYQTRGRSEEWKENVLRNRAVRTLDAALTKPGGHVLALSPLTEGIVVDQITVHPKSSQLKSIK